MKTMQIATLAILIPLFTSSLNGQSVGEAAPAFTVDLQGGGTYSLADQEGKVVLIFFFGNTCPFCISSGPEIQDLYETFQDSAAFTAVGLDTWNASSSEASVSGFRNQTGITFPLALKSNSVSTDFGMTYDRLAVVDQDGVIRHKGTTTAGNDAKTVETLIRSLLSNSGPTAIGAPGTVEDAMTIFPNPAREFIHLELPDGQSVSGEFVLSDLSGRVVLRRQFSKAEGSAVVPFNVAGLQAGVYLYNVEVEGSAASGRIVIQ